MRDNKERFGASEVDAPPQVNQTSTANLNFVIPTELVELPSKGLFYGSEHSLYGKEFVEIKHMTAKEEDILTSANLIEKGVVLDYLIQSLLIDKNINAKSLLAGDQNAILLNARINAYGPEYEYKVNCSECNEEIKGTYDLESIKNKQIEYEAVLKDGCVEINLPRTEVSVKLKYLNIHEQKILSKEIDKKSKLGLGQSGVTTFLRHCIYSIDGTLNDGNAKVLQFIENMPSSDVKKIQKEYLEHQPDIDFSCDVECNSCRHVERRVVPMTAQFFWPRT